MPTKTKNLQKPPAKRENTPILFESVVTTGIGTKKVTLSGPSRVSHSRYGGGTTGKISVDGVSAGVSERFFLPKALGDITKTSEKISEQALNSSLALMDQVAEKIQSKLKDNGGTSLAPSSFEVSFGIRISGGVAFIATVQGECEFSVTATWDLKK
jgi:hypothetical protein